MNERIALEKAIKFLGKYLKGKIPKTRAEMQEVKSVREYLNGMMYKCK